MIDNQQADMERTRRAFETFDSVTLLVLKAHLLVEQKLEEIIHAAVCHPDRVDAARLRFQQKVELAKSFSISDQNNRVWDLVLALNELRNCIAHAPASGRRSQAQTKLRKLYLAYFPEETDISDEQLVVSIAYLTQGFLEAVRHQTGAREAVIKATKRIAAEGDQVSARHQDGVGNTLTNRSARHTDQR